ncbi:MAG: cysteine synthase A [Clostridia bacterium]|nr:cysteine synthase A [Clostridia bacterium]
MAKYKSIEELVGETPLLECERLGEGLFGRIFAKLEYFNPAGSVKDRAALFMILDAEKRGELHCGSVIIEPTSGSTGIGLAAIGTARGYRTVIVMPDTMSPERQKIMKAYGAEVILTDGALGMKGSIERARELAAEIPGAFIPSQFDNPANPEAHLATTGPEIYRDLEGRVDIFVAGAGTGGTVSGVGGYLKSKNKNVKIVAVEPAESPVLSGGAPGAHRIQGIGAGFVPKNYDGSVVDEIMRVTSEDAFLTKEKMARCEGILVGISSGAALHAAILLASREENKGKNIVVLLPDSGERYLSVER